ncbi:MAG: FmdB family transcriptional regulator [Phycisphaerales bacterium]|nr:FmdB family transcriptional regulator [Phycisphaerales bacterium]
MPTYVYEVLTPAGEGTGRHFECVQSMSDKALTKHPQTGEPVRRVPVLPAISGQMSDLRKGKLSDRKLEKLGFTQYARQRDGSYERRFGKFGTPTIPKADE